MRVTSESLCLCIALSREGEEEHAHDLACTAVGQPVLLLTHPMCWRQIAFSHVTKCQWLHTLEQIHPSQKSGNTNIATSAVNLDSRERTWPQRLEHDRVEICYFHVVT